MYHWSSWGGKLVIRPLTGGIMTGSGATPPCPRRTRRGRPRTLLLPLMMVFPSRYRLCSSSLFSCSSKQRCGSGIQCLFDPRIRDGVKKQDPDPGWTTRLIFPRALKLMFFGLKYLNYLMRIQDPGWKTFGSGMNILNGFISVGDSDTVLIKLVLGFQSSHQTCLNPAGPISPTLACPMLRVRDPVLFVLSWPVDPESGIYDSKKSGSGTRDSHPGLYFR